MAMQEILTSYLTNETKRNDVNAIKVAEEIIEYFEEKSKPG